MYIVGLSVGHFSISVDYGPISTISTAPREEQGPTSIIRTSLVNIIYSLYKMQVLGAKTITINSVPNVLGADFRRCIHDVEGILGFLAFYTPL